ncbi:hypothetical protein MMC10_007344 [Thelotrema lepadinum]|nr:hypothetical protein [Thelotrema lepadinum]
MYLSSSWIFFVFTVTCMTLSYGLPDTRNRDSLATREADANIELSADLYEREAFPAPQPGLEIQPEFDTINARSAFYNPNLSPRGHGHSRLTNPEADGHLQCDPETVRLRNLVDPHLGPNALIYCPDKVKCRKLKVVKKDPTVWGPYRAECRNVCHCIAAN